MIDSWNENRRSEWERMFWAKENIKITRYESKSSFSKKNEEKHHHHHHFLLFRHFLTNVLFLDFCWFRVSFSRNTSRFLPLFHLGTNTDCYTELGLKQPRKGVTGRRQWTRRWEWRRCTVFTSSMSFLWLVFRGTLFSSSLWTTSQCELWDPAVSFYSFLSLQKDIRTLYETET